MPSANACSSPARGLDPERWLDDHGDSLAAFAKTRVADEATVEDLVQETLLSAWRSRNAYEGRAAERSWLIGILKRRIAEHWRRNSRTALAQRPDSSEQPTFNARGEWACRPGEWSVDDVACGGNPAEADAEAREFWQVLAGCTGAMPEHLRRVFTSRTVNQTPAQHLCQSEGISRKNLSVRLHRARLLVRRCLESRWFRTD